MTSSFSATSGHDPPIRSRGGVGGENLMVVRVAMAGQTVANGNQGAVALAPREIAERGARVNEAQDLLDTYFGHDVVSNDAKLGAQTSRHILRFQRAEGLVGPDGRPTRDGVTPGLLDESTLALMRERAPIGYSARVVAAAQTAANQDIPLVPPTLFGNEPSGGIFRPQPVAPQASEVALERYTAQPGDRMEHIARSHGVSVADLQRYNPGLDRLYAGDTVYLPPTARQPVQKSVPVADASQTAPAGAWEGAPTERPRLERGRTGNRPNPSVIAVQDRLKQLGYSIGRNPTSDGLFGGGVQDAVRLFQAINGLEPDGVVGDGTWRRLAEAGARPAGMLATSGTNYAPNAPHTVALFEDAIRLLNQNRRPNQQIPLSMARDPNMHWVLMKENRNGVVGMPNYTYGTNLSREDMAIIHANLRHGNKTTRSSATGLGQLILDNVDAYYPAGRDGIGVPVQEAAGMIAYMLDRYGTWQRARNRYGRNIDPRTGRRMEGW